MAAMEAVLAARRSAVDQPPEPSMAHGPGADLRFSVRPPRCLPWNRRDSRMLPPADPDAHPLAKMARKRAGIEFEGTESRRCR